MAKKQSDSQKNPVNIRKLKTNYELRFDFNKMLSEFIKSLPKEHRTTRKDSVINADGVAKDEWVRSIREYAMEMWLTLWLTTEFHSPFKMCQKMM